MTPIGTNPGINRGGPLLGVCNARPRDVAVRETGCPTQADNRHPQVGDCDGAHSCRTEVRSPPAAAHFVRMERIITGEVMS